MVTMPGCTDSLCKECFKGHFQIVIREQGVKHFNCPLCGLPDMTDKEATEGMYMDIFQAMVRSFLSCRYFTIPTHIADKRTFRSGSILTLHGET